MKILKKSVSVILCVLLAFSSFFAVSSYAVSGGVSYDLQDGYLTVTGNGAMDRLFTGDTSIVDVYIAKGITSVPAEAFSGCVNLTTVAISNSVTEIGAAAFAGCASLNSLRLSEKIETVSENTFNGCSALENIKIPDTVKTIKSGAFANCASLDYAIITLGVEEIEAGAFDNCPSLSTVYYACNEAQWADVSVPDGCFGSAELVSAAPVIDVGVTYSVGKAVVSLKVAGGNVSSADMVFSTEGDATMGGTRSLRYLTSSINRTTGKYSIYAVSSAVSIGQEVANITFNTGRCDGYSIGVDFESCYTEIESYIVESSVTFTGENPTGRHTLDNWSIIEYPTFEADGTAVCVCEKCGEITNSLPFAFFDGELYGSVLKFSEYALTPEDFRYSFIILNEPEAVPALNGLVGTDSTVSVGYDDGIVIDYSLALTGDADSDAYSDGQDSVIMMCIVNGLLPAESISECMNIACDCNDDSSVDEADAAFAFNHGIGL